MEENSVIKREIERTNPVIYLGAAAYALLLAVVIPHHEPWADEAQSWLLARDGSLSELWGHLLHYEGTPGLWQTLLHAIIRLGPPYGALGFISAAFAFVAVILVLRYAPFPLYIRLLLPFTYYLFYQYAVIARSYVLVAPLLFAIAAIYSRARDKLAWMSTLLCLLAGVSAHGLLISICIWVALYVPLLFHAPRRSRLIAATLIYWCVVAAFASSAWPAKDVAFAEHRSLANLHLLPTVFAAGLGGAFTGHWITALVLIALSAPLLWRGGGWLFFLLAAVALTLFGTIVYTQLWHFGILFLAWIFALWISAVRTRIGVPALIALIAALGIQCFWSAKAVAYDWNAPYSGSRAAAQSLRESSSGLYAVGFGSVALQPYFRANIYSDYGSAGYWGWSKRNTANDPAALVASNQRELVLVSYKNVIEKQRWADLLGLLGYSQARHFDGATFWQTRVFEFEAYDLYRQTAEPRATSSVNVADPAHSAQLLDGFYDIESGRSRWTARNFSVLLKAPNSAGADLALKLYVPDVQIQKLGPITLRGDANGFALPARTFTQSGEYTYSARVPVEAFRSGIVIVAFHLDKSSRGLNGDARDLGLIVTDVDLAPPSPAR